MFKNIKTEFGKLTPDYINSHQESYKKEILSGESTAKQIENATDVFLNLVTTKEYEDFPIFRSVLINTISYSDDAILRPTVGQVIRRQTSTPDIRNYFEAYFSQSIIPDLEVIQKRYRIESLTEDYWLNIAYVQFRTSNTLDDPPDESKLTAVMTFIFVRDPDVGWKIRLLDSHQIVLNVPVELVKGGDVFKNQSPPIWKLPNPYFNQ